MPHLDLLEGHAHLDVLGANSKTIERIELEQLEQTEQNGAYSSVLRVFWRNLVPGTRLQMSNPTDEPPRASYRTRVSFELRYGMRDYRERFSVEGEMEVRRLTAP